MKIFSTKYSCQDQERGRFRRLPCVSSLGRRQAASLSLGLGVGSLSCLVGVSYSDPPPAMAGLVQFGPATPLSNHYVLVRAGESEAEAAGILLTNPADKASVRQGLSPVGRQQVLNTTIPALSTLNLDDAGLWIWASITQRSYQTAEIIARKLNLGRNVIVPEYSFLDARGAGAFDGLALSVARERLRLLDEAGSLNRPPPGSDGTPNESAEQVLVRLRQMLSVCETQYGPGATVLLVAPDSDTLSILQAAAAGYELPAHPRFSLDPGEVRELRQDTLAGRDVAGITDATGLRRRDNEDGNKLIPCPDPPLCLAGNE